MARQYSPNWYWAQLGYNVERNGAHRKVTDREGNIVYEGGAATYQQEASIAQVHYEQRQGSQRGRRLADINLIWNHTHPEFRQIEQGERCIRYSHNRTTRMGAITLMPDESYQDALTAAKRTEACQKRDELLRPIYQQFGVERLIEEEASNRNSMDDVIDSLQQMLSATETDKALLAIRDAQVPFPAHLVDCQ